MPDTGGLWKLLYPDLDDPADIPDDLRRLADGSHNGLNRIIMPTMKTGYVAADFKIPATATGKVAAALWPEAAVRLTLTNPSPILNLLVEIRQWSWCKIAAQSGSGSAAVAIYEEPAGTGATVVASVQARLSGDQIPTSPVSYLSAYRDLQSSQLVQLTPGQTLTARGQTWTYSGNYKGAPLSRYRRLSIIPMAWTLDKLPVDNPDFPDTTP